MTKLALKEKEANDDTTSLSVDGASESESDIVKEKVGESYEICERLFFTFFFSAWRHVRRFACQAKDKCQFAFMAAEQSIVHAARDTGCLQSGMDSYV